MQFDRKLVACTPAANYSHRQWTPAGACANAAPGRETIVADKDRSKRRFMDQT